MDPDIFAQMVVLILWKSFADCLCDLAEDVALLHLMRQVGQQRGLGGGEDRVKELL